MLGIAAFIAISIWAAKVYTPRHPLDLTRYLPKIEHYFDKRGLSLRASKLEAFYDGSLVLRVHNLSVYGPDGQLGIYVDQAGIRLANHDLLLLRAVPKTVEVDGVTLRLVRDVNGVRVAGLDFSKTKMGSDGGAEGGFVGWLNNLSGDATWHRVKNVRIGRVTILARDDLLQTEWVLEDGSLVVSRYPDDGERGTMKASLRRLYGPAQLEDKRLSEVMADGQGVPVVFQFRHLAGAKAMSARGLMQDADTALVADYMPPKFADLIAAKGEIGVGTRLLLGNKLEKPFVSMDLHDVTVRLPEGYSKPLEFPHMAMTAMYQPPVEGVSNSDILTLGEVSLTTVHGASWQVSGTVFNLTTDPMIDMHIASAKGPVQGVFDFFPDEPRGFKRALAWLRPNIRNADYSDLVAHYAGKPSAFPDCGDNCGEFHLDAKIGKGTVKFLPEFSPVVVADGGVFRWRGQQLEVDVPHATLDAQDVSNVAVQVTNLFSPDPTHVIVSSTLSGPLRGVLQALDNVKDVHGHVPLDVSGTQVSHLSVDVPMPRGKEPTFEDSTVLVSGTVSGLTLQGMPELASATYSADTAKVDLTAGKYLHIVADGNLDNDPMAIDWVQNIDPRKPSLITLSAHGTAQGAWLLRKVENPDGVALDGPVGISANMKEGPVGVWGFGVHADARRALVGVDLLNLHKKAGTSMVVDSQGIFGPDGKVKLNKLKVTGKGVDVSGTLAWNPAKPDDTAAHFSPFKSGNTDVTVDYAAQKMVVSGSSLDVSGVDLFGGKGSGVKNLGLSVNVKRLVARNGIVDDMVALFQANKGQWTVRTLKGGVGDGGTIDMETASLKEQQGRSQLTVNIQNLGKVLDTLGLYDKLRGGTLSGEVTYDSPTVGGGVLKIDKFELKKPPILMQLLSLLSLEQIVAGTDSVLFDKATLPVRVDGQTWNFDNALLEGPSMSIRIDGAYMGDGKELNINGQLAPAIPLNRLVAKIPLLGRVLTGSQDGLVVADFKLKGPVDKPDIHVRPLSVITPGLLKDLWKGITSNGSEQPAPKVEPADGGN